MSRKALDPRRSFATLIASLLVASFLLSSSLASTSNNVKFQSNGTISYDPSNVVNQNLGRIPDDWQLAYGSGPQIYFVDTAVERRPGNPSFRLEAHTSADVNTAREIDGKWYTVKPGDRIVLKVWVKTGASGLNPDPSLTPGGRVGMDYYGHTTLSGGTAVYGILFKTADYISAQGVPGYYGDAPGAIGAWSVPYGKDWTMIGWNVTIPADLCTYVWHGGGMMPCTPVQIDSFVAWLDVRSIENTGLVWFADGELYINPTGI